MSKVVFFNSGKTIDSLKTGGTSQLAIELLTIFVIGIFNTSIQLFISWVGMGSEAHYFVGDFLITFSISSTEAGLKYRSSLDVTRSNS